MMMKQVLLVLLFLASGLALSVSESMASSLKPHAAESFHISYIQMKNGENCSYTVTISTSCSSPWYTSDQISIAFGDAYGHQIYAPRLDDPVAGTFGRCSSDLFKINGPCAYDICYAYLHRSGPNGWKPESVKITGEDKKDVTFYFNATIPEDTWYGYNLCDFPTPPPPPPFQPYPPFSHPPPPPPSPSSHPPPPPSSSYRVSIHKWLIVISVVLGLVLSF